jgi:hypothetical protein
LARSLSPPDVLTRRPGRPLPALAFSRSVQEPQTRLTPPPRRAPPGQEHGTPPDSSRRMKQDLRFRCRLNHFDASTTHARPRTQAERFLERLPGPHLTRSKPRLFPERSPRRSSANAASRRFDAHPRRADAGGPTSLHLSHSTALWSSAYSTSSNVRDTRFAGTTGPSDFPRSCIKGVPPSAFPSRPASAEPPPREPSRTRHPSTPRATAGPPGSRAWRDRAHAQVLRPRGTPQQLAITPLQAQPSAPLDSVGIPNRDFEAQ